VAVGTGSRNPIDGLDRLRNRWWTLLSGYKLLALDLDGTLLNEEREVSARNREAIQKAVAAGIVVCVSTGRGMKSALEHVAELDLRGPFVTANGSEVWRTRDELLSREILSHATVARLLQVAEQTGVWFWAYTVDGLLKKEDFDGDVTRTQWLKMGFYDEDAVRLGAARTAIADWPELEISNSHLQNIEINPRGVTKATGLQQICDALGISFAQVIACGDSLNDVAMIQAAGLGVAMGNAQPAVKAVADWETLSNDEDGVALVIEKFILKR
jgi:HAD superfamily hydrolase (TIGR01484 family)